VPIVTRFPVQAQSVGATARETSLSDLQGIYYRSTRLVPWFGKDWGPCIFVPVRD